MATSKFCLNEKRRAQKVKDGDHSIGKYVQLNVCRVLQSRYQLGRYPPVVQ